MILCPLSGISRGHRCSHYIQYNAFVDRIINKHVYIFRYVKGGDLLVGAGGSGYASDLWLTGGNYRNQGNNRSLGETGISGSVRICSGGISGAVSSPHAGSIIFMIGNSAGGVDDYGQTITYREQMRLNNSGYLGIGTTAPISSLHINSPTTMEMHYTLNKITVVCLILSI